MKNSIVMVLLYLAVGVAFGHGLSVLISGDEADIPLVIAMWIAAALLLIANYRRSKL